jgi:hypothetical protein
MAKPRSATKRPYRVFVSHASADKWIAKAICGKLEAAGAATFRDDRDIDGGDDIPESIRAAIAERREMVVLLTPESVNRPWVLLEVGAAWMCGADMRIIAVRCHVGIEPIPDMIKQKKVIGINDFDEYIAELSKRLKLSRRSR